MRGLAFVRAWNISTMQGHAKFAALGIAVLVFGVFQLPQGAIAQTKTLGTPKTTAPIDKAKQDPSQMNGDQAEPASEPAPKNKELPQAPVAQAPAPPKISSIGELISMVGMTKSPEKPFAAKSDMAKAGQPRLSYEALRSGVSAKGGPAKFSGRRVHLKGTVLSVAKVGTSMAQVLLGDTNEKRCVASLVTLPRGAAAEFEVGKKAEMDAVFGQAVWRPGYKGTLLMALGGSWDKWQDEDMTPAEIAATYLRPNPVMEAASADAKGKSGLQAWHVFGQVEHGGGGTMLITRNDGKRVYAQNGQLLEPGIRVLKVGVESVVLRVDNREVTVRAW